MSQRVGALRRPMTGSGPDLRCAIAHRGISRFRVRCFASPRNDGLGRTTATCEIARIMACLATEFAFCEDKMTRAFAILFAAMTLLAGAGRATAQSFDNSDILRP